MSWIKERNARESLVILRALSNTCAALGGDVSAMLNEKAKTDDGISELMSYDIDYAVFKHGDHYDVIDAIYARQILALFQKSQFLSYKPGWDKAAAAAMRFVEAEAICHKTNNRFKDQAIRPENFGADLHSMLHTAQGKIAEILGMLPSMDELPFAFGPGANTNVKSSYACPRAKLGVSLECSTDLSPTVGEFLYETPHWAALHATDSTDDTWIVPVDVVPGKVIFVPKNAKTDRTICIEPLLNSFLQKGYGSYIRNRLLRFSIDLRDQSRNQYLARLGSTDGSLATLDLSMASDCVARELVWSLLPFDWAELLARLRTSSVVIPKSVSDSLPQFGFREGPTHLLEKFSSMGNGYTFELESLIFYGLCFAACTHAQVDRRKIGVYGDDLIVPTGAVDSLTRLLEHCGFSLNTEKSFSSGPFRESCGADYLNGFDIRPFYQKTLISDRNLYTMHNWFVRAGEFELAKCVKTFIVHQPTLYGPDGYGDGHLIGTHVLRRNRKTSRDGWSGGYFDTYVLKAVRNSHPSPGDAVLPVYSVYTRSGALDATDPDIVRGSRGYAKVSIYTLGSNIFSRKQ